MATLPVVPGPFTDGTAPTIAQLNQLSGAVQFISDLNVRPLWHAYKSSTASLGASAWTDVTMPTTVFDSDSVMSGGIAVLNTQGRYAAEACVGFLNSTSERVCVAAFVWTAGNNNPHHSSGTTLRFGARGGVTPADGSDAYVVISDMCPYTCYPGDSIKVQAYSTASTTIVVNSNGAYNQGRFVTGFSGWWLGEAS